MRYLVVVSLVLSLVINPPRIAVQAPPAWSISVVRSSRARPCTTLLPTP